MSGKTKQASKKRRLNMRSMLLLFAAIIAFLWVSVSIADAIYGPSVAYKPTTEFSRNNTTETSVVATPSRLLELTNAERTKVGSAPLDIDARMNGAAQRKADDMYANKYFAHVSPMDGREGYEYSFDVMGGICSYISENISKAKPATAERAILSWMRSKAHRDALLDTKYSLVGFGVKGDYVVQHLCQLNV